MPAGTELFHLTIISSQSSSLFHHATRAPWRKVSAVVLSCDGPSEMTDTVRLHFLGLLISCAWWIGTSGTLTSSNSSWPTALIVYQSGSCGEFVSLY